MKVELKKNYKLNGIVKPKGMILSVDKEHFKILQKYGYINKTLKFK